MGGPTKKLHLFQWNQSPAREPSLTTRGQDELQLPSVLLGWAFCVGHNLHNYKKKLRIHLFIQEIFTEYLLNTNISVCSVIF